MFIKLRENLFKTWKDFRRNERGVVFIVALFAVVVAVVAGSFVVTLAGTEVRLAYNYRHRQEALNVAEAGVEHATWQLQGRPGWDEGYQDIEFGSKYSVAVNGLEDAGVDDLGACGGRRTKGKSGGLGEIDGITSYKLTGTGISEHAKRVVETEVRLKAHPSALNALFIEETVNFQDLFITSGCFRTNGNAVISKNVRVEGNLTTGGTVIEQGGNLTVLGTIQQNVLPLNRPKPPLRWFEINADQILDGDQVFSPPIGSGGILTQLIDGLIVVKGDLTIQGKVNTKTSIMATGNIIINGNIDYVTNSGALLALTSFGTITMTGEAQIDAFLYSYQPLINLATQPAHVFGAVSGQSLVYDRQLQIDYDPRWVRAPVPGLAFMRLETISWKEIW
ncbi:MAG: hypothetical protein HYX88_01390 [Chloroflexi bacterium]|nr:hypothetical protein [Chloroflexota bacterium]